MLEWKREQSLKFPTSDVRCFGLATTGTGLPARLVMQFLYDKFIAPFYQEFVRQTGPQSTQRPDQKTPWMPYPGQITILRCHE